MKTVELNIMELTNRYGNQRNNINQKSQIMNKIQSRTTIAPAITSFDFDFLLAKLISSQMYSR